MRKLRLRFILPVAQLATAVILLHWGYAAYLPKGFDTAYVPTGRLIFDGINAPARLVTNFIEASLPEHWHWRIVGSKAEILIFLLLTALLWYLAGRELELRLGQDSIQLSRSTKLRFYGLLCALGVALAISSAYNFGRLQDLGRWNNFVGNAVEGTLYWAWSLILIIFPSVNLVNAIRNKDGRGRCPIL
jgi:hypothetical protein